MMVKPKVICVYPKTFFYRHHVEHRVKLYMPAEESFSSPLEFVDVTRTTETTLDAMSEKENCRTHGQVSRDSLYCMRSHLMDIHGPEGD